MSDKKLAKEIAETILAAIGNVPGVNKTWLVNVIDSKLPSSPELIPPDAECRKPGFQQENMEQWEERLKRENRCGETRVVVMRCIYEPIHKNQPHVFGDDTGYIEQKRDIDFFKKEREAIGEIVGWKPILSRPLSLFVRDLVDAKNSLQNEVTNTRRHHERFCVELIKAIRTGFDLTESGMLSKVKDIVGNLSIMESSHRNLSTAYEDLVKERTQLQTQIKDLEEQVENWKVRDTQMVPEALLDELQNKLDAATHTIKVLEDSEAVKGVVQGLIDINEGRTKTHVQIQFELALREAVQGLECRKCDTNLLAPISESLRQQVVEKSRRYDRGEMIHTINTDQSVPYWRKGQCPMCQPIKSLLDRKK